MQYDFRDILGPAFRRSQKYVFQYKNDISFSGLRPPDPDPRRGLDPRYMSALPRSPTLLLFSGAATGDTVCLP